MIFGLGRRLCSIHWRIHNANAKRIQVTLYFEHGKRHAKQRVKEDTDGATDRTFRRARFHVPIAVFDEDD